MVRRTRGGSLIVDLVADDGGTVLVMFENLADHSLTIKPVCRVRKVGILTVSVIQILSAETRHDDFRMLLIHPSGDGSCRRTHDDADPSGMGTPKIGRAHV